MKYKLAFFAALVVLVALWFTFKGARGIDQPTIPNKAPIPALFEDKSLFLSSIKKVQDSRYNKRVTGLTVPHHLLASDLIARAFHFASRGKYRRILLLCPDHFKLGDSNISTTGRNFATVFGELSTDREAVQQLKKLSFVHEQNFLYREHGIETILPFIKYYFSNAKIIPLVIKTTTSKSQLDQVITNLKQVLKVDSLVVQSTDFSHYLTPSEADVRDQQTIEVLRRANPDDIFTLTQPSHLDSLAAQYIQMRLQNEFFESKIQLLDHKNSQDYSQEKVESSTSYIVQGYCIENGK